MMVGWFLNLPVEMLGQVKLASYSLHFSSSGCISKRLLVALPVGSRQPLCSSAQCVFVSLQIETVYGGRDEGL